MRTRTVLIAVGVLLMGYAVAGALTDPDVAAAGVLLFLAGVLAGHDIVWMAVVMAAGAVLSRLVPRRHRAVAQAAAISAAAITVVALPLVLGSGRAADNPSVLPLAYGCNLAVVLLVIAVGTLLARLLPGRPAERRKKSERPADKGRRPGTR